MLSLLLSTLEMMGLTFVIGFFVAAVIKIVAVWADSLDFYSSHQEELIRLKRLRKIRQKVTKLLDLNANDEKELYADERENYSRGINSDLAGTKKPGYYHGVSHGASKMDLLEYYYPDMKEMYLKNREELIEEHKNRNKKNQANNK